MSVALRSIKLPTSNVLICHSTTINILLFGVNSIHRKMEFPAMTVTLLVEAGKTLDINVTV